MFSPPTPYEEKSSIFKAGPDLNDNQTHIVFNAFVQAWDDQKNTTNNELTK